MKSLLPVVIILGVGLLQLPTSYASGPILENPELEDGLGTQLPGWQLNNASVVSTDDAKTAVLLPSEFPGRFAKLWQRIELDGNEYASLRVTMLVRTVGRSDADTTKTSDTPPRLRIFYFPENSNGTHQEALWPHGQQGAFEGVQLSEDWQEVSFELFCPEDTRSAEIAIEADNPPFAVEVDNISIEATRRS
jgi:hypothetical protein